MLKEVIWFSDMYNPSRHCIAEAKSQLDRLEIMMNTEATALMQRFQTVHELVLKLGPSFCAVATTTAI